MTVAGTRGRRTARRRFARGLVLLLVATMSAAAFTAGHARPVVTSPSTAPVEGKLDQPWWAARHRAILATVAAGANPELLLIGDSITQNYEKAVPPDEDFQPIWREFYAPRRALNLGYSGDRTENVLWRIRNGEIDGLRPKGAIVLIGTNDTNGTTRGAAQVQAGIEAIVAELKQRLRSTRIIVVGILPSAISPAKSATDAAINRALAVRYDRDERIRFLDVGPVFRTSDGTVDARLFYDPRLPRAAAPLHPDSAGQRRMAEAIEPTLEQLLGKRRLSK